MESIVLNVRDIDAGDRHAIEHVVGATLLDSQRLVIQIVNLEHHGKTPAVGKPAATDELPDWCNVYEGLSDAEIANLETSIVRSHESRSFN